MKNKRIKIFIETNKPYIIIFILVLLFEVFFYQRVGDELTIQNQYFEIYPVITIGNCIKFIIERIKTIILTWSSRTIIDTVSFILIFLLPLWKVLNAIMYAVFVKALCAIFKFTAGKHIALVCAIVTLVPQTIFLTAGWLMTSIAYFWPVVLATVAMAVLLKDSEKLMLRENIIAAAAILYAANEELMCVVLLVTLLLIFCYRKDRRKICAILECIVLIELLWALLGPGNQERFAMECKNWFWDFNSLTLIKKMELGFSSTMNNFLLRGNQIFLVLNLLIAVIGNQRKMYWEQRIIINIPIIASVASYIIEYIAQRDGFNALYNSESKYGSISLYNFDNYAAYIPLIFYIFVGGSILLSILIIGQYSKEAVAIAIILLTGVAARCAIGFSPTIWISNGRTFSVLYYVIVFIILIGIKKIYAMKSQGLIDVTTIVILAGSMYEVCEFVRCF